MYICRHSFMYVRCLSACGHLWMCFNMVACMNMCLSNTYIYIAYALVCVGMHDCERCANLWLCALMYALRHVCFFASVCMPVCACVHGCVQVFIWWCMNACIHVCLHACMHASIVGCIYVCVIVCVCVWKQTCMTGFVLKCAGMHTHTNAHTRIRSWAPDNTNICSHMRAYTRTSE